LRNFHSSVKSRLFARAILTISRSSQKGHTSSTLLDLGAGRGADCARYKQFKNVLAIDKDQDALGQLQTRLQKSHKVCTLCADMTQPFENLGQFHVISAMFSCHYACETIDSLDRFANNVASSLKVGGCFIGIDIDGRKVTEALDGAGRMDFCDWAILELQEGCLMVTIRSISDRPKKEWLVDWPALCRAMANHGLSLRHTELLDPTPTDISHSDLRAFSRLHRVWMFQKGAGI